MELERSGHSPLLAVKHFQTVRRRTMAKIHVHNMSKVQQRQRLILSCYHYTLLAPPRGVVIILFIQCSFIAHGRNNVGVCLQRQMVDFKGNDGRS